MDAQEIYELVTDAVREAMRAEAGGLDVPISRRMAAGKVVFEDGEGRLVKELDAFTVFRKVTAVREKLRVLEQKINNADGLAPEDRAEIQGLVSRAYGSLTTFNFLFSEEADKFKGTGG